MLGYDKAAADERSVVTIYKTTDGGANWTTVSSTGTRDIAYSQNMLPIEATKMGLKFVNQMEGWITLISPSRNTPWLYHTLDGGKTWHPASVQLKELYKYDSAIAELPSFFNSKDGVIPLYYIISIENKTYITNALVITKDGGNRWYETKPVQYTLKNGGVGATDVLSFHDAYVNASGQMFRTNDAGQTWTAYKLPPDIYGLDFITSTVGYAVGGDYLWKTTDGGRTWMRIQTK